jgi:hypothetical protein
MMKILIVKNTRLTNGIAAREFKVNEILTVSKKAKVDFTNDDNIITEKFAGLLVQSGRAKEYIKHKELDNG